MFQTSCICYLQAFNTTLALFGYPNSVNTTDCHLTIINIFIMLIYA